MAAPPERGRANAALIELLADALSVPRTRIRLVGGHTARRKVVEVDGLDADSIGRLLARAD